MTNSETKSLIGYLDSPQFTKAYQEQHKVKQAQRKKKDNLNSYKQILKTIILVIT